MVVLAGPKKLQIQFFGFAVMHPVLLLGIHWLLTSAIVFSKFIVRYSKRLELWTAT